MSARKSDIFILFIALNLSAFLFFFLDALSMQADTQKKLSEERAMIEKLGLTDLCLFTDARYMRHPSMADLNTPFQDHPTSIEHFPSGTLAEPPRHLRLR
ncbi:MAG TPA: hypothetical protein VK448_08265 [Dissulfurispiraceae bacterium]|nr:hypothetical protein [Dissulfurispiraceae bacterium]